MIGYVSTRYGARSVVDVRENVGSYLSLYGSIDGFFLDELSSGAADLPHYANITSYIRQVGRLQGEIACLKFLLIYQIAYICIIVLYCTVCRQVFYCSIQPGNSSTCGVHGPGGHRGSVRRLL